MSSPLFLLHGFTGAPSSFDAVLQALPTHSAALRPWLMGHGNPAAGSSIEDFESEVERLAAPLSTAQPACVVGYSLGARLALGIAVRHPARVAALVLISGHAGLRTAEERASRREQDARRCQLLERQGLAAFVASWEQEPLFASQASLAPALQHVERERRLGHTAPGLCRSLRTTGLAEMPDYWAALPQIRQPVTFLAGELDARFCALGRAVVGELPAGQFRAVPGAGHNLLLERPTLVAEAILRGTS